MIARLYNNMKTSNPKIQEEENNDPPEPPSLPRGRLSRMVSSLKKNLSLHEEREDHPCNPCLYRKFAGFVCFIEFHS